MKTIKIIWDEEADKVAFNENGKLIDSYELLESLSNGMTFDDGYYLLGGNYTKKIAELGNKYSVTLEWEDCESYYFANADECMKHFKDRLIENGFSVECENVDGSDSSQELDKLVDMLDNRIYLNNYNEIKDDVLERLEVLGVDAIEFDELIKNNFYTNGRASRRLMGEEGLLQEWMNEDFDVEEEEYGYSWEEISSIIRAMNVAHNRHRHTEYDSINKSNMTEEQIAQLRKFYNQ